MKIVTVLGARPQFIKAGSVSREIAKHENIREVIVHTGQHFDANMSDIFFEEMQIPKPDYNLNINGLSHGAMTGQMLEKIEKVLLKEKPDWVLVYGDTNSTLAGALAASKLHIPVAHVEAGLRSFNMQMPEEINRILTDRVSTKLFCPSQIAVENLEREGFEHFPCEIFRPGDVMQDGALFYAKLAQKPDFTFEKDFILSTVHRAENTDDLSRLNGIVEALNEIAKTKQVVLPLHPRTKAILKREHIKVDFDLIEPVGYLSMIWMLKECNCVITDSGGLQKEAYFFQNPCLTLRDDTEWWELVKRKFNVLVGANKKKILDTYAHFEFAKDFDDDLFGGGRASERIIAEMMHDNL